MLLVLLSPDIQERPDPSHRSIANFPKIETSKDNPLVTYLLSNFCDGYKFISVTRSCATTCNSMDCSIPGFPINNSQSLLKCMSIESVMPSNHLILCCPLSCLQPFPASGSFPVSWLFASGDQNIGASASVSVLPMSIQR